METNPNITPNTNIEIDVKAWLEEQCRLKRLELIQNNYSKLTTPIADFKVRKPSSGLLVRHNLAILEIYEMVFYRLYPDYGGSSSDVSTPDAVLANIFRLVSDIVIFPHISPEKVENLYDSKDNDEKITSYFLCEYALGRLDLITSKQMIHYGLKFLEHDALAFDSPVSIRLGLQNTIVGYDIDAAAGLYRIKKKQDLFKIEIETQAALMGAKITSSL